MFSFAHWRACKHRLQDRAKIPYGDRLSTTTRLPSGHFHGGCILWQPPPLATVTHLATSGITHFNASRRKFRPQWHTSARKFALCLTFECSTRDLRRVRACAKSPFPLMFEHSTRTAFAKVSHRPPRAHILPSV